MQEQITQGYDKDKHIAQLEATNKALAEKIVDMNKRQQLRHDATSLKWRNECMYLRKKCAAFERLLEGAGISTVRVDLTKRGSNEGIDG